jgi:hypothetical protein
MADRGMTAAIAELIEAEDEAVQLGLFGEPLTEGGAVKAKGWNGVGRKPGAKNKRTERTVTFLLARHRDPRQVLLEIAEANVFDLAALLKCSPHEAMQEKRLAAIGVLPYVAAKITPDVVDNRQVIYLTIGSIDGGAATGAGGVVQLLDPDQFEHVAEHPSALPPPETGTDAGAADIAAPSSHARSHK